jgi:hypothetical protein
MHFLIQSDNCSLNVIMELISTLWTAELLSKAVLGGECEDKQVQLDGEWVGSQCAISRGGSGLHKSIISVSLIMFCDSYLILLYTVGLLHK